MDAERDSRAALVDAKLGEWRQGDCVLNGEHWFVHRLNAEFPMTDAARAAADTGGDLAEQDVIGFVVVTQTCDIVRSCDERHFIEVCPLIRVEEGRLREIQRGRRPAYAYLPLLAKHRLVADLDRVMTVEKPLVASWARTPGWTHDADGRAFGQALARKRVRFAFPNEFTAFAKKLQGRLVEKHGKTTDEGRGLRALREIRVQATPSWAAAEVELFFWFIRNADDVTFEGKDWANLLDDWLKLVSATEHFKPVHGQLVTLRDMTAEDYLDSDPLDLDNLSSTADETAD